MALREASTRKKIRRKRLRAPVSPASQHLDTPHLCLLRAPSIAVPARPMGHELVVATYNVHRWSGINGRGRIDPARACFVVSELAADVIALQEVMRPHRGEDPLEGLAESLGLHVAFAATRVHKRGELGNAILSRWPISGVSMLDLSYSRLERRVAVAAQFTGDAGPLDVVATHLALGDRTRQRQVRALLDHPRVHETPTVLLGDLNVWRNSAATKILDDEFESHNNRDWPASFPSTRPVLALDRVYTRGAKVLEIKAHDTAASRRASDHLPVIARVQLP